MIKTDVLIIGAGPVGLFSVFEAGLLKLSCHLVDSLAQPGGQLSEIYPKKPIYDIPGYPSVMAQELVDNLLEQIKPFRPGFTLGERVESITRQEDDSFIVITNKDTVFQTSVIAIAAGLGSFEPRKPPIASINKYEDNGVDYIIREPSKYQGQKVVISGGGDSALDWTIELSKIAREVTLIHRRNSFRGAPDSVSKVQYLAQENKINLITEAEVTDLRGEGVLEAVQISLPDKDMWLDTDYFIPLFGLSPKLGPIADWGLNVSKNAIEVDTYDYSTNVPGVYAIGDINTYPGKLKLILCGFHEGTLMMQSAFKRIYPDQKLSFKYTTVTGIKGLDK